MTLDEAIKHCKEKAKELSDKAYAEVNKTMTEDEAYECNECAREHEQLAEWLTELKERREADRWIPVSEKLPEQTSTYLVTIKFIEDYEECIMTDKVLYNIKYGWNTADEVTAWKPLPEAYKENDK